MKIILYHNNNCSKSRECLKLLEDRKVDFDIRNYLKSPLNKNEIESIIKNLSDDVEDLVRNKKEIDSKIFKSKVALTKLILGDQKILQRPIIFYKTYWICRPPERVLHILGIN